MRNLASSIQVEYEKVSSDRRVCDFETVFPLTGRSVGSRPLRSTSAAGGSGAHGRRLRRRRCARAASRRTDARAGRLEWSDDERATTRESTDVPCGEFLWDLWVHVRGQMLCFVVVEWSHAWCLLLSSRRGIHGLLGGAGVLYRGGVIKLPRARSARVFCPPQARKFWQC